VSTFECRLDQDAWRSCAAPPGTYVIQVDDGPHQLRVRASDPSGNKQQARIVVASWTQRSKPQIVFRTAPGAVSGPDAHFEFSAVPADSTLECRLDDDEDFAPCDGTVDAPGLDDGAHVLAVRAKRRNAKDLVTVVSRGWTVDSDRDDDGFAVPDDCDDGNPLINPQAEDLPGDGIDQDCDGADGIADLLSDADGDVDPVPPDGGDCDDHDPNRSSLADEVPENGVDEDCDGVDALRPPIGLRFQAMWSAGRTGSRLLRLTATRVPAGTAITVTCRGHGCPSAVKHIDVPRRRRTLPLLPYLGGRVRLPAGAILTVRAARGGRSPEGRVWRVRRDRKPLASAFCEHRGRREPGRC